jgi:alpha-N-acetylglucosamine transferase
MKGIVLLAIGKKEYGRMAYNMALSLKYHSNIPVQLVCERQTIEGLDLKFFDIITEIDSQDCWDKKFEPGKAKLSIHKYLHFDESIYLDVDGVCVKPIDPLFDECEETGQYFLTQYKTHIEGVKPDYKQMLWAWPKDIWEHYKLKEDAKLPATNSSFMYMKKGEELNKFFTQCLDNFNNPVQQRLVWGNSRPDELYLNVAMAQFDILGKLKENYPIYFNGHYNKNLKEDIKNYYVLGLFGIRRHTHNSLFEYADILMYDYSKKFGKPTDYRFKNMINHKQVGNR